MSIHRIAEFLWTIHLCLTGTFINIWSTDIKNLTIYYLLSEQLLILFYIGNNEFITTPVVDFLQLHGTFFVLFLLKLNLNLSLKYNICIYDSNNCRDHSSNNLLLVLIISLYQYVGSFLTLHRAMWCSRFAFNLPTLGCSMFGPSTSNRSTFGRSTISCSTFRRCIH
jgi:hypothetical protein